MNALRNYQLGLKVSPFPRSDFSLLINGQTSLRVWPFLSKFSPQFTPNSPGIVGAFLYPGTVQRGRATTLLFLAQLVKIFPRLSHKITQNTNHLMSSGAWGRGIGEADEREVGNVSEGRGAAGAGILGS
ncbi:hypothetical protein E2C01_001656 [Portunus trituberculatus]|uniref:Uncharacterized protein n=1 Tax=Portunus trituberculatus TaxID=210409 RepID=A0A5B7CJZ3_PORTR|nr:hypothetical protein [Portunus trituberculatus]